MILSREHQQRDAENRTGFRFVWMSEVNHISSGRLSVSEVRKSGPHSSFILMTTLFPE